MALEQLFSLSLMRCTSSNDSFDSAKQALRKSLLRCFNLFFRPLTCAHVPDKVAQELRYNVTGKLLFVLQEHPVSWNHATDRKGWKRHAQRIEVTVVQTRSVVALVELSNHEPKADSQGLKLHLNSIHTLRYAIFSYPGQQQQVTRVALQTIRSTSSQFVEAKQAFTRELGNGVGRRAVGCTKNSKPR